MFSPKRQDIIHHLGLGDAVQAAANRAYRESYRTGMEVVAKVTCEMCEAHLPLMKVDDGSWWHGRVECRKSRT